MAQLVNNIPCQEQAVFRKYHFRKISCCGYRDIRLYNVKSIMLMLYSVKNIPCEESAVSYIVLRI